MATRKPKPISTCPQCNADLNAIVRLNLYGVTIIDGILTDYEGGPATDSDSAVVEICEPSNTIIFCEAGHLINDPNSSIDPLRVLELIAQWPANSNSEPDIMGQALQEITSLATTALQPFLAQPTIPFQPGQGYNSKQTGDHYIYTGLVNNLYSFYRPSTDSGHRLTRQETEICFDYHEQRETDSNDSQASSEWHNSTIII